MSLLRPTPKKPYFYAFLNLVLIQLFLSFESLIIFPLTTLVLRVYILLLSDYVWKEYIKKKHFLITHEIIYLLNSYTFFMFNDGTKIHTWIYNLIQIITIF